MGAVKGGSVKGGAMKEGDSGKMGSVKGGCHEGIPSFSGQQAGGRHPTGMLSCFWRRLHLKINFYLC